MDSFKKVCEFMQGVTPSMIEQKFYGVEIVDTKKDNHRCDQTTDDCLIPSFLEDALYKKRLQEAIALFSRE